MNICEDMNITEDDVEDVTEMVKCSLPGIDVNSDSACDDKNDDNDDMD